MAHVNYAVGKGTAYVLQLRRLSLVSNGVSISLMKKLYVTVATTKMLYAADVWFRPLYWGNDDTPQRGSIIVAQKLTSVQQTALLTMTGAMRTTATDTLEAHTNILPIAQHIQNLCH